MTKQTKLSIIATTILLGLFWLFIYANQTKADDSDSRKIWDLEYQMNELRKQKEACFNALTYSESIDAYNLITKPCSEFDEQIMALREQADLLKSKDYEVGLGLSR